MGTAGGDRRALPSWMLTPQGSCAQEPVGKPESNPADRGVRVASSTKGPTRKVKTRSAARTSKTSSSKLRGGFGRPVYCMSESELLHTALQFLPDISDTDSKEATPVTAPHTEERKRPNVTSKAENRPSESEELLRGTVSSHGRVTRPPRGSETREPRSHSATRLRQISAEDEAMNVLKEIFFKK